MSYKIGGYRLIKYSEKIQVRIDPSTMFMLDTLVKYSKDVNNDLNLVNDKRINRSSAIRACIRTTFENVIKELNQNRQDLKKESK